MEALVKAEDTGDRDKHEELRGRSWGCGEPLAPAGIISAHCSHWASPEGGCGAETGLAWFSLQVPKPLLQNTGPRRVGAGKRWHEAGLGYLGWPAPGPAAASTVRELALDKVTRKGNPLPGISPFDPCFPVANSSRHWEQLWHPLVSKGCPQGRTEGPGRGYSPGGGKRGSVTSLSRHCWLRRGQPSGRLSPSSSALFGPCSAGKGKGG